MIFPATFVPAFPVSTLHPVMRTHSAIKIRLTVIMFLHDLRREFLARAHGPFQLEGTIR